MNLPPPTVFHAAAVRGLSVHPFTVSATIEPHGNPGLTFDGPAPRSTPRNGPPWYATAGARVRAALAALRLDIFDTRCVRITHTCPADVEPLGAADLALACAIAEACGRPGLSVLGNVTLFAALTMTGELQALRGLASVMRQSARMPWTGQHPIVTAHEALPEAHALAHAGVRVYGARTFAELFDNVSRGAAPGVSATNIEPATEEPPALDPMSITSPSTLLAIACVAAGEHGVFFVQYGDRETAIACARAITRAMPAMTFDETLDVACAASAAYGPRQTAESTRGRPFVAPDHTAQRRAILGGGNPPSPGQIALAHRGVLCLDGAARWDPDTVAEIAATQPECGVRADGEWFPAYFTLAATDEACPCRAKSATTCVCTPEEVYAHRVAAWRVGRLCDILVAPSPRGFSGESKTDAEIRAHVRLARDRAIARQGYPNGRLLEDSPVLAMLDDIFGADVTDVTHVDRVDRVAVARVARTLADLSDHDEVRAHDIEDALDMRRGLPRA